MKKIRVATNSLLMILSVISAGHLLGDEIDFNRDIRPILSDRCYACHGPDQEHRQGGFRLDDAESPLAEADSGEIPIVPGKAEESELLRRILTKDPHEVMPPPESNKPLTNEQIAKVRLWIEQGAQFDSHWSFQKPTKQPPPESENSRWNQSVIDRFLIDRIQKAGLSPSGEASKETLIRRVTFDLTGLPPSPQEVEEFLKDESSKAYEDLVDRLLASPHYGEHMARFWLDAVRYADTHGMHFDNYREMWMYRDWVIQSFNGNKPYDQFVTEQIAGDLMPDPSWEQLVASGYNRCNLTTNEGGSIKEEVRMRNVVDRVVTTGTVFMGLTMDCTRCHDHKFDPLTMNDFYSMYAYFNSLDGNAMDGNKEEHPPIIYSREAEEEFKQIAASQRETNNKIATLLKKIEYSDPGLDSDSPELTSEDVFWVDESVPGAAQLTGAWDWVTSPEPVHLGERATKFTAEGNDQHYFVNSKEPLTIYEGDVLFCYVYLDPKNPPKEVMLQWNDGAWEHRAFWGENLIPYGSSGDSRRHMGDLPETGKWVRLSVAAEKVGLKPGAKVHGIAFTQFDGTVYWDAAGVTTRYGKLIPFKSLQQWIEYVRQDENAGGISEDEIKKIVKKKSPNKDEQKKLREYFLQYVSSDHSGTFMPLRDELKKLEDREQQLRSEAPTTLIYREKSKPEKSFILARGEYDQPKDEIGRAVPAFLPPMTDEMPNNRLGLALWLVHPDHPLTARVAVNRYWQQVFGIGLVETSEDFGAQGSVPSHPELLDHLAVDFQESGWDIKQMMKKLVMTSAYRQASHSTTQQLEKDPKNRLLSRGPRFRLDAEMLRDQALALSGLLVDKLGGPSVKPPQPAGLWNAVAYSRSNTGKFVADKGPEKIHRRTLYTFYKRTAPAPQLTTFDAPSREACVIRRERTNTPMQALLMMNDPQFLHASSSLAQRVLKESPSDDVKARVDYMVKLCLAGTTNDQLSSELVLLYNDAFEYYKAHTEMAKQLSGEVDSPVDRAAWTVVCNAMLNLDVLINKN